MYNDSSLGILQKRRKSRIEFFVLEEKQLCCVHFTHFTGVTSKQIKENENRRH